MPRTQVQDRGASCILKVQSMLPCGQSMLDCVLTSQKAEGTNEGLSLEANARTGADAAIAPCVTASKSTSASLEYISAD